MLQGHYRYAQAYKELGELEKARQANTAGLKTCPQDKDLQMQKDRFWKNYTGTPGNAMLYGHSFNPYHAK